MKKASLLAAILLVSCLQAQVREDRKIESFTGLKVGSAIKVVLTMSDKETLTFEAEESVLPKLRAEVKGGVLHLSSDDRTETKKSMTAYVSARSLKSIHVTGASEVTLTNALEAESLDLESTGAADLDLNIKVKTLDADVTGAADVVIKGQADRVTVDLSGASDFKCGDLEAADVKIKATGASNARVNASEKLRIDATGASKVIYKGSPKNKEINSTGASTVKAG